MSTKKENMFKISKDEFTELHNLAEVIIATKSAVTRSGVEIEVSEVIAAVALQAQIDFAKENNEDHLILTENEIQFLAAVIS